MRLISNSLLLLLLCSASVNAQSQALTPDQLTHQLGLLSERNQNTDRTLKKIKQHVTKIKHQLDNRTTLKLMQTFEELAVEVSQMRGELEQQGHEIAKIKKQQSELYLDTDRRLRMLETVSQTQTGSVVDGANPDNRSTTTSAATTVNEEQLAYQTAFDTLKEGRYKKAKVELQAFLRRYPDSNYAANAQYWLGEAYYVTRDFDQSIIQFEGVISNYPGSSKIADSMLKLGYTHYEKKQYDKAKTVLSELQQRYPQASAARLADKRLQRMQQEGH